MNDVEAPEADFDGVCVGKGPLCLLALYLALAKYDPDVHLGGKITNEDDDE